MSTMTAAARLNARLQNNAAPIKATRAQSRALLPVAEPDQATVRQHLVDNCPAWLLAFWDISTQTGHRTGDVAGMTWSNVNWEENTVSLVIAKQSKSARARAVSKGYKMLRENRQQEALAAGDSAAFMYWARADRDTLAESASEAEINEMQRLVDGAKLKTSTLPLTPDLVERLREMKAKAFWDDGFIFSRALTESNSTRLESGKSISRQTFWKRFRDVFDTLKEKIANAVRLSVYSTRKTYCRNIYEEGGHDVATVMALTGHSSELMVLKYLGVEAAASKVHNRMIARMSA